MTTASNRWRKPNESIFFKIYHIPRVVRFQIYERDGWACYLCGVPVMHANRGKCRRAGFPQATLDHKVPKSRGGKNTYENLATCCYGCNKDKAAHPLIPYIEAPPTARRLY